MAEKKNSKKQKTPGQCAAQARRTFQNKHQAAARRLRRRHTQAEALVTDGTFVGGEPNMREIEPHKVGRFLRRHPEYKLMEGV